VKKILLIPVAMVLVAVLVLGGCAEPASAPSPEPAPTPAPGLAPSAPSRVGSVDVDNTAGPCDAKSWTTAHRAVQEGLDDAEVGGG